MCYANYREVDLKKTGCFFDLCVYVCFVLFFGGRGWAGAADCIRMAQEMSKEVTTSMNSQSL